MKLKKDTTSTIRISKLILAEIKRRNWSVQKLIDWAIAQKIKIEIKLKEK